MEKYRIRSDNGDLLRLYFSTALPSKRQYREHHHTELEISLVKEGSGIYTVKDRQYEIRKGDIFLFGTHEEHYITDITEGIKLMNLHFEPRFIWANRSEMFDLKYLKIFFDRSQNFQNRLDRENKATEKIRTLLVEIEKEFGACGSEYEMMVKVKLLTVLVLLIREFDYVENKNTRYNNKYQNINSAMKYIDENFESEMELDEIAFKVGMNKSYFITLFKQLNGVTPWEYITARRIEYALELLKGRTCGMDQIAAKCGFGSTSNFNRTFKRVVGVSPTGWRKNPTDV